MFSRYKCAKFMTTTCLKAADINAYLAMSKIQYFVHLQRKKKKD